MSLDDALREALPEVWVAPDAYTTTDLCAHELGAPSAWARPRDASEVQRCLALAREHGAKVAVAGARTAYWRPLSFEGALVLDTNGLDAIGPVEDGRIEVGAGAKVHAVSAALEAAGAELLCHPDAYGDGTVGAMAASAFSSGRGMGRATANELVRGLTVVLGTGELVQTGTARALGHDAFARLGLPDATGLFLGAGGALGVIVGLSLRAPPQRWRAALRWRADGSGPALRAAVELAEDLRARGAWHTFRVEAKADGGAIAVEGLIVLDSPFSEAELAARVADVGARVEAKVGRVEVDEAPARFWGPPEQHAAELAGARFRGVDVVLPYPSAHTAIERIGAIYERARGVEGLGAMRAALYFAPDYVNVGVHTSWRGEEPAQAFVAHATETLGALPSVPYRWGAPWASHGTLSLDPGYAALMRAVAERCDPDGLLASGPWSES